MIGTKLNKTMPELPEVENVRRSLEPLIKGKVVSKIEVRYDKIIDGDTVRFCQVLKDKKILGLSRYGKYLLFRFSNGWTVVSHLRMEGHFRLVDKSKSWSKSTHVLWKFTDESVLAYLDVRKFGRMQLVKTGTEFETTGLQKLGPEPGSSSFIFSYFENELSRHRRNIKSTLLAQSVVCGLGNIYVDEILWRSRIHPLSCAKSLPKKQIRTLWQTIDAIIPLAIQKGGTTIRSYTDANGNAGQFQNFLAVYGRSGQKCRRCGTVLVKIKVQGRGTTFCPHCQEVFR